ncbi:BnaA10g13010D [Brassica napus]|uniref:RBR-type E3 ubiquitin transferase n=1 Tax=Brassica napus TaxID=3708 RepID=A0A078GYN7_BRANA|nr:BnaA10g13010D [Brassica napus]
MDFHGGSVTGATTEKLSEMPCFHKRYSKGLMTMETALELETWNHEDQHVFNTNGRLNEYYTTYKEAEIRDLTRGLAEATKVKKNIARLRDDAQTIRSRLRSSHLAMVDGTYIESDYEVIKEPETTRDLYLVPQANKCKKAELGVAIYDMKDNLLEGQLQENYMTLMGRRAMYPLYKAKSSKEKESCVICFDEDIDSDLMFSLLDGTIPNCLHHGCTTQLSVDTCGKLLTPEMCLKWKERTKENSVPYNERVYCPYKNCSYLMSRTELVLGSACGHRKCLKCGCSFCFYCKAPWHSMLSCTDYKKLHSNTQNAKLISLANLSGWRQCGKCNHMVERSGGCGHMTCRCGYHFCYDCGVGMNSLFIHSCRISRDDHVPQPRIMSETDATTAALQAILNASINFFFIIFFCFIMYKVLG